jgi:5-methylthioadenosine/S-adenosylhomocysteine deaminase
VRVDSLIHARWIIPVEPENVVLEHHSIAIVQGKIVAILPTVTAEQHYQAAQVRYLSQHLLIPGLINAHTHAAMSLMRGLADDLPLMEWLQQHIWPLEQKWVGVELVKDGTDLAIAEMLRSGTTCFNDMYFFPEITAQQAMLHGIRASIGLIVIDFPTAWANHAEQYLQKGLDLHGQLQNEALITTPFAPHAPYTVADSAFKQVINAADLLNLPIHIHIHETSHEVEQQLKLTGERPLQRLHTLGLVNSRLIAVHATQLTSAEIQLLADAKAHIVHCPESNLKLASGFCPVTDCLAAGINIALGTDGAASNNDLDMLGEMRTAALLAKGLSGQANVVDAMTVLKMATLNGAKALGIADRCGSLVVNKAADMVAIEMDQLETLPIYHPISHLVYACSRHQITDVWVNGKLMLNQRHLTTFDESDLKRRVLKWQQRLTPFS